ncbi:MAG: DUF87 domain-containing protein [Ignavibacteriaceae bacterium]|nr:DUF87 domain-containing protein [Ignavibacteriaceae bacterium]
MKADIGIGISIQKLIETRALVQANSGGGKSYLLRKLLEETHGKVQQIILDIEGEFSSLREKFDYVVFGEGGDYPLSIKYADQMAKSLMELSVSAIIDLSELEHHHRIIFVERFLHRLVNLPKNYWKPCLIVIDEAHQFCPQNGNVSSAKPVIDLCTRGRKRGYSAILATQRISKLHKDAAAETLNKFIGRTGLDVDMKRAAEELGMSTKQDMLSLRALGEGDFFAFGPAISNEVTRFHVEKVKTNHPRSGSRIVEVPKPSDKIKELLGRLKDLPEEAEKEQKTIDDLRRENTNLKTKLTIIERTPKTINVSPKEVEQIEKLKTENSSLEENRQSLIKTVKEINSLKASVSKIIADLIKGANSVIEKFEMVNIPTEEEIKPIGFVAALGGEQIKPRIGGKTYDYEIKFLPNSQAAVLLNPGIENIQLGKCAFEVLKFLAVRPYSSFSRTQIGAMTGYAPNGGSFNNSISELRTKGLIDKNGTNTFLLNQGGVEYLKSKGVQPGVGDYSPRIWLEKLPAASKKIYEILLLNSEHSFSKGALGEMTGYEHNGGSFNNAISKLCVLGLAERYGGQIRLNQELINI